ESCCLHLSLTRVHLINGDEGPVNTVGKIGLQALLGVGQIEPERRTSDPAGDLGQKLPCHERYFTSVARIRRFDRYGHESPPLSESRLRAKPVEKLACK